MPSLIVWRAAESGLGIRGPHPQSGWGLFSAQGQEWRKASEVLRVPNLGRHLKNPEGECLFSCLTLVLAQSGLLLGGDPFLLSNLGRDGRLQGPEAAPGFAPNQVGSIKLMALQVKSIQLELLPSPSPCPL